MSQLILQLTTLSSLKYMNASSGCYYQFQNFISFSTKTIKIIFDVSEILKQWLKYFTVGTDNYSYISWELWRLLSNKTKF